MIIRINRSYLTASEQIFLDPRLPGRFWSKCIVDPASGCWLWAASVTRHGYGRFGWKHQKCGYVAAHRLSYSKLVGEIPEGLELDHLCRVTRCVNPSHLEPVTHRENMLRGNTIAAKSIAQALSPTCPLGHLYPQNVERDSHGTRHCLSCFEARRQRDRELRKAVVRTPRETCRKGHSFSDAYVSPKTGGRQCRTCRLLAEQRRQAKEAAVIVSRKLAARIDRVGGGAAALDRAINRALDDEMSRN